MIFANLQSAVLLRRYKRFLADVLLPNSETLTIHCANTGSMLGCGAEGDTIWYSTSTNKTRKYPHSWEFTQSANGDLICINTVRANQLFLEALQQNKLPEFSHYQDIETEVKYGEENSRVDFLLKDKKYPDCYIEVKSATFVDKQIAMFPDAVTVRGQKHLRELIKMRQKGYRCVIFFTGLHSNFNAFQIAQHIDPNYNKLFLESIRAGVEAYCYGSQFEFNAQAPYKMCLAKAVNINI